MGIFLDYNFSSDILSGKLTKLAGHFRNLPILSDRPTVFAKTERYLFCNGTYGGGGGPWG